MATYLTPGVYVEQVPSAIQPIAGVGTSTAAFVGVSTWRRIDDLTEQAGLVLSASPAETTASTYTVLIGGVPQSAATLANDTPQGGSTSVNLTTTPDADTTVEVHYTLQDAFQQVTDEKVGTSDGKTSSFQLKSYPILTNSDTYSFALTPADTDAPTAILANDDFQQVSTIVFSSPIPKGTAITASYLHLVNPPVAASGDLSLVTNFSEYRRALGDFSQDSGLHALAHAVYGFFNNGGTRCYVAWVEDGTDRTTRIQNVLTKLMAIDEIALVAAPGLLDEAIQGAILDHCEKLADRFAILDGQPQPALISSDDIRQLDSSPTPLRLSSFAAMYYPWITVYDPVSGGSLNVAPSGHIAGIYARVDAQRGVNKAPANEVILGALDVQTRLSDADQAGLNPDGINAIRLFSGGVTVWGARTLGGDANEEWKYLSVRRLMIFLAQSIKQGTQWVVFEPNDAALWAKITRNITAFLTLVWRSGALFGATPQQAFFVKCDAETNPEEVRDAGQVITQIGVAVTKPAEFVIFQISQWAGPGQ